MIAAVTGFSQTTCYPVEAVVPAIINGVSANWNSMLNGSCAARSTPLGTALLIDETNIGGAVLTTGTINATTTATNFGQLLLQNNATKRFVFY